MSDLMGIRLLLLKKLVYLQQDCRVIWENNVVVNRVWIWLQKL